MTGQINTDFSFLLSFLALVTVFAVVLAICVFVISLIIVIAAFLFCMAGRTKHPMMQRLRQWNYAHRGLHDDEKPENSMAAFRAALDKGYGIELDLHLMKDGNVAVIHDASLKRVANADVFIEDQTLEDLPKYCLGDTQEQIPLFRDVLTLFDGKAPMIVELKSERDNYEALCRAALALLDDYKGDFCIESFDPRVVRWLKNNRPDICRGQLAENWFRSKAKLPFALKFLLSFHLGNIYSRPDFIAYNFRDRRTFGTGICRRILGVQGVSWTIRSKEDFDIAVNDGWIPIFENFEP